MLRMRALTVQEGLRGYRWGPATKAIRRLQGELGWVGGSEYKLVVDLAACMKKDPDWRPGCGLLCQAAGGSKRQQEAAEGEGGVRGWVEDEEEEARRQQQLRP